MIDAPSRAVRQPPHAAGLRCERLGCGGPLLWQRENKFEWLAECVKCGNLQSWEHIRAPHQPQPQPEGVCTPLLRERDIYMDSVKGSGWIQHIRDAVVAIVADDAEVEARRAAARTEAERCVAALRAYGAADVPVLPWVRPVTTQGRRSEGRKTRRCVSCGIDKSPSNGRHIRGQWTCMLCQRKLAPAVAS
jgi:hypothetical protein